MVAHRAFDKYKINIPEMAMLKSGLKAGDELEVDVENKKLILKVKS